MKDIADSISEWFREKRSSPIYGIFLAAFLAWNWQMFYALFWENEELLQGKSTLEYARQYSHAVDAINTGILWKGIPIFDNPVVLFLANFFLIFSIPFLVVYMAIWWFPYVYDAAYNRYLSFHFSRKYTLDKKNAEYQQQRTAMLKIYRDETKEQTQVLEEIATETEKKKEAEKTVETSTFFGELSWEEDYAKFRNSNPFYNFREVYELIYKYGGKIHNDYGAENINAKSLAYADSNGIVSFDVGADRYELTDKGRFFVKKFLEEGNG